MSTVVIRVDGMPAVKAMLATYSPRQLQNKMRRVVRAGAKPFQGGLKSEARQHHGSAENVPISFQKVPAAKVTTRGGSGGRDVEAYVRPKSALFNIFEPGAGEHRIAAKGKPLRGPKGTAAWDPVGRKRGYAFGPRGQVRHPGLKPRELLPSAFNENLRAAILAVSDALFNP